MLKAMLPVNYQATKAWLVNASRRHATLLSWAATLVAVYLVQYVFVTLFLSGHVPSFPRPFRWIPTYLFVGWDGAHYRHLWHNYDRYLWPPLYPLSLRLVYLTFQFNGLAFEKSAVVLNLCMHGVIVWGVARYLRNDSSLPGVAPWLVTFLLFFFPGHNVFFAAYSESFYLAVTLVAFILHREGRLGPASAVAGISALIRNMGAFLSLALVLEQLLYCWRDRKIHWKRLAQASWGLVIVALWNLTVKLFFGKTLVGEEAEWIGELLRAKREQIQSYGSCTIWPSVHLSMSSPFGFPW